jgi:hypothetical protein
LRIARDAANAIPAADAIPLLDEILALMADSPERVFINMPQGRRVRLDRYLQGAILTLLDQVEASGREELEQHLASALVSRFDAAESPRGLWQWINRSDRLIWGQRQAVRPESASAIEGGERQLPEMLLWELSSSSDPQLAAQAILRLAELPSSRVDGVPELLLERISPYRELTLDKGSTVAEIIDTAGEETVWPLARQRTADPFWPPVVPVVTERSRPLGTSSGRVVGVAASTPSPLSRLNVTVVPMTGVPNHVRFSGIDRPNGFWSAEVPAVARLEQNTANPYYTPPPSVTRGWSVGPLVYLQVDANLNIFRPFDDEGEPNAQNVLPRRMEICSIGSADLLTMQTVLPRRAGVRETETVYSDSFGYRTDLYGPFLANFFCTPETGDLVVRSSATGRELWSIPVTSSSRWLANDEVVIVYDEQSWRFAVHRAVDGEMISTHDLPAKPRDVLQSAGATLLLEMPPGDAGAGVFSQLVAWNAQAGEAAWNYPLSLSSLVFLIDQQLVGVIDRATEQIELIDISTGAVASSHLPDQPDQVDNVHCIVDADQVVVIVTRASEGDMEFTGLRDPRIVRLNGTLHAFDRKDSAWIWSRHVKDIDIHLDQPKHIPLLVMHEYATLIVDPFAFSEAPTMETKLRFAVIDRRTGDMLVDEVLEHSRPNQFDWLIDVDAEDRTVQLRTNAERGYLFDYRPDE